MPERWNEDGSIWTINEEIADLVDKLTTESQRRGDGIVDDDDAGIPDTVEALGFAAGFDGAILLRLAHICEYQQTRIEQLKRQVEQLASGKS